SPSGGRPLAWASRWRTVAPSGPPAPATSSSRPTVPSSTATWTAMAASTLLTDASGKAWPVGPWPARRPSGPRTPAATVGTSQSWIWSRAATSARVPQHGVVGVVAVEQAERIGLVDVADEPVVGAVAAEAGEALV